MRHQEAIVIIPEPLPADAMQGMVCGRTCLLWLRESDRHSRHAAGHAHSRPGTNQLASRAEESLIEEN